MIFEDKISRNSLSDNESSIRNDQNGNHLDPFSFSAIHFLRNRLLPTGKVAINFSHKYFATNFHPSDLSQCYNLAATHSTNFPSQTLPPLDTILPLAKISMHSKVSSGSDYSSNPSSRVASKSPNLSPNPLRSPMGLGSNPQSIFCNNFMRRPRGEKRPIPEEQKDEKYFERRKRNNEAAKKSRDARKMREDRVRFVAL